MSRELLAKVHILRTLFKKRWHLSKLYVLAIYLSTIKVESHYANVYAQSKCSNLCHV